MRTMFRNVILQALSVCGVYVVYCLLTPVLGTPSAWNSATRVLTCFRKSFTLESST